MEDFEAFNLIIPGKTLSFPSRAVFPEWSPVFVVGCPRSGTTVVGECISGFNDVESVGESIFVKYLWRLISDLYLGINARSTIMPFAKRCSSSHMLESIGNLSDALFDSLRTEKTPFFVDHTPWNGACLPLLVALYPHCRIVHVVRNPVAVTKSLSRSYERGRNWAQADPTFHARLWFHMTKRIEEDLAALNVKSIRIHYEEFCSCPEKILNGIADKIGLIWNASALHKVDTLHASTTSVSKCEDKESYLLNRRLTVNRHKEEWPDEMNEDVRKTFAAITHKMNRIYKYELD